LSIAKILPITNPNFKEKKNRKINFRKSVRIVQKETDYFLKKEIIGIKIDRSVLHCLFDFYNCKIYSKYQIYSKEKEEVIINFLKNIEKEIENRNDKKFIDKTIVEIRFNNVNEYIYYFNFLKKNYSKFSKKILQFYEVDVIQKVSNKSIKEFISKIYEILKFVKMKKKK